MAMGGIAKLQEWGAGPSVFPIFLRRQFEEKKSLNGLDGDAGSVRLSKLHRGAHVRRFHPLHSPFLDACVVFMVVCLIGC